VAIINTTFGFVFVHVPKTAGTSVTSVLSRLCTIVDVEIGGSSFGESIQHAYKKKHGISKHATSSELCAVLGEQQWMRYTSFGVVRHPLSRLSSAYRFLRKWDSPNNEMNKPMMAFKSFADFVASDIWIENDGPDRMFKPQAFWLLDKSRSKLLVDRVLKMETLNEDLAAQLKELNIPASKLPKDLPTLNATEKSDADIALPPDLMSKVMSRYSRDLNLFGYSTEPKSTQV